MLKRFASEVTQVVPFPAMPRKPALALVWKSDASSSISLTDLTRDSLQMEPVQVETARRSHQEPTDKEPLFVAEIPGNGAKPIPWMSLDPEERYH
jgi:hypothetical protein